MVERWRKIKAIGWVAHLLRMWERFNERLGFQFAAAITYFSVMSIIPILAVVFAAIGLTVTVLNPQWSQAIRVGITEAIGSENDLSAQLVGIVDQAFTSWQVLGPIGLVSALWTGATWVRNLRADVRVMTSPSLEDQGPSQPMPVEVVKNIGVLFGLVLLVGVSIGLSSIATAAHGLITSWLGLGDAAAPLLRFVPLLGTVLTGWLLFVFVLWALPLIRMPWTVLWRAGLLGGVGFGVLQFLAGSLVGVFKDNPAAAVFGSAIVVVLALNLFATLILVVAAWAGTHQAYEALLEPDAPARIDAAAVPREPSDYATKQVLAELQAARERADQERVPQKAAVRSAQITLGVGVVVGGVFSALASRFGRRR
ncbi:MAG: YhjD/YihY/BrkB family envelope integrity protein [Propioniciclava sp.]|uniref:YhjD/YihY/BrkB family envelope integrity protein n=1 Tax=Propioniciclava sp. TaxID=2038686 RepID=UPI0039E4D9BC